MNSNSLPEKLKLIVINKIKAIILLSKAPT